MKSLIFCMVFFISSEPSVLPDMTGITNALKSGNAEVLSRYFDESVELAILDDEDLYSKEEAKELLSEFFSSHKVSTFSQVHKGTSKGEDSHYVIGDLDTAGENYRVYLYLKVNGDQFVIQELRIEE